MNNKIIEKSFLIHLLVFIALFMFLNYKFDFNILKETENAILEYEELAKEEMNLLSSNALNNSELNMDDYAVYEYIALNSDAVSETIYLLNYYIPAFYILLILLLVLIENSISRRYKFYKLVHSYDPKRDDSREKLIEIIKAKLNFKYKRITLPKHIPFMCALLYIISFFITNEIMLRTLNNMIFALMVIITVFGFRVVIKFFKTKNEIIRFLIIVLNIFIGLLIPQMYFIIGFIKSLMNFRIVIKSE